MQPLALRVFGLCEPIAPAYVVPVVHMESDRNYTAPQPFIPLSGCLATFLPADGCDSLRMYIAQLIEHDLARF